MTPDRRSASAVTLLGLFSLGFAVWCLWALRGTTFFFDEWDFVLDRRGSPVSRIQGADQWFLPHNSHLLLTSVGLFRGFLAIGGVDHYEWFRAAGLAGHLLVVWALFWYARKRVGPWLALAAAIPILAIGRGSQSFLIPLEIARTVPLACFITTLRLLESPKRFRWPAIASLTTIALASSGIAVPLTAALLAEVVLVVWRDRRSSNEENPAPGLRSLFAPVVAFGVPLSAYTIWFVTKGESRAVSASLWRSLTYAVELAMASAGGLFGVPERGGAFVLPGVIAVAIVFIRWGAGIRGRLAARATVPRTRASERSEVSGTYPPLDGLRVVVLSCAAAGTILLTAWGRAGYGEDPAPRYIYAGAVLLAVLLVELAAPVLAVVEDGRVMRMVATGVAVAAVVGAAPVLSEDAARYRDVSARVKLSLAVAEIGIEEVRGAGGTVEDETALQPDFAPQIGAARYAALLADKGSPIGDNEGLLSSESDSVLASADDALAKVASVVQPEDAGVRFETGALPATTAINSVREEPVDGLCTLLITEAFGAWADFAVGEQPFEVVVTAAQGSGVVRLRRFSESFVGQLVVLTEGQSLRVSLPPTSPATPLWTLRVEGTNNMKVCPAG